MSYIEIKLGGKTRGLKFNQLAFEEFTRKLPTDEKNVFDWTQSNSVSAYASVYAGLVGNAIVKNEVIDFTFENVCDWVDVAETADIQKAWNLFAETQWYKKMLERFNEQIRAMSGEKKSQVRKKK